VSAASAVNAKGACWFATYKGGMSAELFVAMLGQLMRYRKKPLFVILDSLPAHKAKVVQNCVKSAGGKLELWPNNTAYLRSGATSNSTIAEGHMPALTA
jgi:hypothetical protein